MWKRMYRKTLKAEAEAVRRLAVLLTLILAVVVAGCGSKPSQQPPEAGSQKGSSSGQTNLANGTPIPEGTYQVKKEGSQATYTVEETFVGQTGLFKAVGTTSTFEGTLEVKGGQVTGGTVKVDLRTLKSDRTRRDETLRNSFLESNRYPFATYVISGMEGGPIKAGEKASVTLKGKMTIHETDRDLSFPGTATFENGALKFTGEVTFKMSEFGIKPPDIIGVLKAEDPVILKIEVAAVK
jgi:polyisoprenoid-binding protein YceI